MFYLSYCSSQQQKENRPKLTKWVQGEVATVIHYFIHMYCKVSLVLSLAGGTLAAFTVFFSDLGCSAVTTLALILIKSLDNNKICYLWLSSEGHRPRNWVFFPEKTFVMWRLRKGKCDGYLEVSSVLNWLQLSITRCISSGRCQFNNIFQCLKFHTEQTNKKNFSNVKNFPL